MGLSPFAAPVLLAVVLQRRTTRAIATAVDLSVCVVLGALHELRRAGFVDWVDGQHGSIRPLVEITRQGGPTSTGHGAPAAAGAPCPRPVDVEAHAGTVAW